MQRGPAYIIRASWRPMLQRGEQALDTAEYSTMANAGPNKQRPKYLSLQAILFEIRLPLAGWISILHRVSGVLLFVSGIWLLFLLDRSLSSEAAFAGVRRYLEFPLVKLSLLVLVWAYCHHLCAGIRFLLLDLHKGIDKASARASSIVVLVVSLLLTAFFGAKLW
jgi:succinate dehydrogenase / fumarate reductase cytochrome b subunit